MRLLWMNIESFVVYRCVHRLFVGKCTFSHNILQSKHTCYVPGRIQTIMCKYFWVIQYVQVVPVKFLLYTSQAVCAIVRNIEISGAFTGNPDYPDLRSGKTLLANPVPDIEHLYGNLVNSAWIVCYLPQKYV